MHTMSTKQRVRVDRLKAVLVAEMHTQTIASIASATLAVASLERRMDHPRGASIDWSDIHLAHAKAERTYEAINAIGGFLTIAKHLAKAERKQYDIATLRLLHKTANKDLNDLLAKIEEATEAAAADARPGPAAYDADFVTDVDEAHAMALAEAEWRVDKRLVKQRWFSPYVAPRSTWKEEPCNDGECAYSHTMPPVGSAVVVISATDEAIGSWREPGSTTMHDVKVGTRGTVIDTMPEWHNVCVMLEDSRHVWIDPELLTDAKTVDGWTEVQS